MITVYILISSKIGYYFDGVGGMEVDLIAKLFVIKPNKDKPFVIFLRLKLIDTLNIISPIIEFIQDGFQ